ncbi:MAG: ammonia channel protein, partial [Undibacterium sp.]|nr:ammonia channel protein [Undibacterium sp.]
MKKLMTKVLAAGVLLVSAGVFSSAMAADEATAASAVAVPVASVAASATADAPAVEVSASAAAVTAPAVTVDATAASVVAAPAATPNKGDTAWMMVATMLVILMTIPGLALFYGGLVRSKNMLSVLMQVFMIFAVIIVLWCIYGYSL